MAFRIATLAGNGAAGYGGDGRPAERALLNWPRDVALDAGGVLYIADTLNHRVRRIDIEGIITTVVGTGSNGYSGDGGPAISAQLAAPRGVAVAADGCLYVSDTENHCVRRIGPDGRIDTIAGTGTPGSGGDGGRAADAQLSWPSVIAIGRDGSAYVADSGNHRIRLIGPDGRITAVAGTGEAGCSGDGGPAADARLSGPRGLAVSPDGGLFVADTGNHRVRKVSLDGMICTVAGTGDEGREGDGGPATGARLSAPRGLAVGPDGRLFIADCDNSLVRQVTPDGMIVTVAGNGTEGYSGDGGPAISAQLADPHGIVVSKDGTIYTAEPRSSCVRKIWCTRP
jgi:DNA-binding beta-propeller fold protein YncE